MKNVFLLMAVLTLFNTASAKCINGEERINRSGAVFTCDTSNPRLGEAFRSEKGIIWGEPIKKKGLLLVMGAQEASEACAKINARLPSAEDYSRLINELKGHYYTIDGSSPMITDLAISEWFWTSTDVSGRWYRGAPDTILGPNQNAIVAINGPHGKRPYVELFLTVDSIAHVRCISN